MAHSSHTTWTQLSACVWGWVQGLRGVVGLADGGELVGRRRFVLRATPTCSSPGTQPTSKSTTQGSHAARRQHRLGCGPVNAKAWMCERVRVRLAGWQRCAAGERLTLAGEGVRLAPPQRLRTHWSGVHGKRRRAWKAGAAERAPRRGSCQESLAERSARVAKRGGRWLARHHCAHQVKGQDSQP